MTMQKFSQIFFIISFLLFLVAKLPVKVYNQQLTNRLEMSIDKYHELYEDVEQLRSKVRFLESNDRVMTVIKGTSKGENLQTREENIFIIGTSDN